MMQFPTMMVIEMNVKMAMECYFTKLKSLYKEKYNTFPTVTYTKDLNPNLLYSKPNDDGEIEWMPCEQTRLPNFSEVENCIGIKIGERLREYYSSYMFIDMSGKIGRTSYYFYPIGATKPVEECIKQNYEDGKNTFQKDGIFAIGNVVIAGDDQYILCFDVQSDTLCVYGVEDESKKLIGNDFVEIIFNMEAMI